MNNYTIDHEISSTMIIVSINLIYKCSGSLP